MSDSIESQQLTEQDALLLIKSPVVYDQTDYGRHFVLPPPLALHYGPVICPASFNQEFINSLINPSQLVNPPFSNFRTMFSNQNPILNSSSVNNFATAFIPQPASSSIPMQMFNNSNIRSQIGYRLNYSVPLPHFSNRTSEEPVLSELIQKSEIKRNLSLDKEPLKWTGRFETNKNPNCKKSPKVFIGGVPFFLSKDELMQNLSNYGVIEIDKKSSYAYALFADESDVNNFLNNCFYDFNSDSWFFVISTRNHERNTLQIVPWFINDSNWHYLNSPKVSSRTVFVGGLHGRISAANLSRILNDLFDNVTHVNINVDKQKYAIGSARVVFGKRESFVKAVCSQYVEIDFEKGNDRFRKKLQIDPYIEESNCGKCLMKSALVYCRDERCCKYFCLECYQLVHQKGTEFEDHYPVVLRKLNQ